MKYVALDLETWGLFERTREKRRPEGVAQISLVVEDTENIRPVTELPHYTVLVAQDHIDGEAVPLAMNAWILAAIARFIEGKDIAAARGPQARAEDNPWPVQWLKAAFRGAEKFLEEHFPQGKITAAGKNVMGFDLQFLPPNMQQRFRYRHLDPTMLATDFIHDEVPPNLSEVKRRLGVPGVARHDAYNDNLDTILCLRTGYGKYVTDQPVVELRRELIFSKK